MRTVCHLGLIEHRPPSADGQKTIDKGPLSHSQSHRLAKKKDDPMDRPFQSFKAF